MVVTRATNGSGAVTVTPAATSTPAITYEASTQKYIVNGHRLSLSDFSTYSAAQELLVAENSEFKTLVSKRDLNGATSRLSVGGLLSAKTEISPLDTRTTVTARLIGEPTVTANIPKSGAAEYKLSVFGLRSDTAGLTDFKGQGTAAVDFAKGAIVLTGSSNATGSTPTPFNGLAYLTSQQNASGRISGIIDFFGEPDSSNSTLWGDLYGTNASEIGFAFSQIVSPSKSVTGFAIGYDQKEGSGAPSNLNMTGFYTAIGSGISSSSSDRAFIDPIVYYDRETNRYSFANRTGGLGSVYLNRPLSTDSNTRVSFDPLSLDVWSSLGSFDVRTIKFSRTLQNSENLIVFGATTPTSAMPKSGTASYSIGMYGKSSNGDVYGAGSAEANFTSNTVTIGGNWRETTGTSTLRLGTFSSQAAIGSSSDFTGSTTFNIADGTGAGTSLSGQVNGRFFGPDSDEIGAALYANGSTPGISGVIFGVKRGLSETPVTIGSVQSASSLAQIASFTATGTRATTTIGFDPARGMYATDQQGQVVSLAEISKANRDGKLAVPSGIGPEYTAFGIPGGGFQPRYSTMFVSTWGPAALAKTPLGVIGLYTGFGRMPVSGKATYTGATFATLNVVGTPFYPKADTSIEVDFAKSTFDAKVNVTLAGAPVPSDLSNMVFSGIIEGDALVSKGSSFQARFFGPQADEIGGSFYKRSSQPETSVNGVFILGK